MVDEASFPEGFAIPLFPKSRKRKLSRRTLCIICQTNHPWEPLRKTQEDSIEKAIKATEQRRDEEVRAGFLSRQNYARYLPVHLADVQKLEVTTKEFAEGNQSISRSGQPFSQVSTDMALEQSINADLKSSGGVIGISQSPSAHKHRTMRQLRKEFDETKKMSRR